MWEPNRRAHVSTTDPVRKLDDGFSGRTRTVIHFRTHLRTQITPPEEKELPT